MTQNCKSRRPCKPSRINTCWATHWSHQAHFIVFGVHNPSEGWFKNPWSRHRLFIHRLWIHIPFVCWQMGLRMKCSFCKMRPNSWHMTQSCSIWEVVFELIQTWTLYLGQW